MRCQAETNDGDQCSRNATVGGFCAQHAKMATNDVSRIDRHRLVNPGGQYSGNRDIYDVLGYPDDLDPIDFWNKYQRQDLARRVVSAPADKTWGRQPTITEKGSGKEETEFEKEFDRLAKKLKLWHYLKRADRLSGVGKFGILLIGFAGEKDLEEPVGGELNGIEDVIFLQPYHELSVEIKSTVEDPGNPRFGLPEMYKVEIDDSQTEPVHWTRVIHLAEGLEENDVYGTPRLRPVYNRFMDLQKIVGGSAETFWRTADRGIHLRADAEHDYDTDTLSEVEEKAEEYYHNLRKVIQTKGVDIESLGSDVAEPNNIYDIILQTIGGGVNPPMPQRIMTGTEAGELASSQDEANWLGGIADRQKHYAGPFVLRPFIDRLQDLGALPKVEYEIEWPSLFELTDLEKAEKHKMIAQAMKAVTAGMPSEDFTQQERREALGFEGEKPDEGSPEANEMPELDPEQEKEYFERAVESLKNEDAYSFD
ncbi:MAG: anti-CBASS protein Acb1 family protein [Candidatus Bipolaricaulia bacterium]